MVRQLTPPRTRPLFECAELGALLTLRRSWWDFLDGGDLVSGRGTGPTSTGARPRARVRPESTGRSRCLELVEAVQAIPCLAVPSMPYAARPAGLYFSASESLAISALASTSSGSGPPWRTPGRDEASASSAPCLATSRTRMIVERPTPARSAASRVVNSPLSNPTQISYFCVALRAPSLVRARGTVQTRRESRGRSARRAGRRRPGRARGAAARQPADAERWPGAVGHEGRGRVPVV